jgi:hypothetical protein
MYLIQKPAPLQIQDSDEELYFPGDSSVIKAVAHASSTGPNHHEYHGDQSSTVPSCSTGPISRRPASSGQPYNIPRASRNSQAPSRPKQFHPDLLAAAPPQADDQLTARKSQASSVPYGRLHEADRNCPPNLDHLQYGSTNFAYSSDESCKKSESASYISAARSSRSKSKARKAYKEEQDQDLNTDEQQLEEQICGREEQEDADQVEEYKREVKSYIYIAGDASSRVESSCSGASLKLLVPQAGRKTRSRAQHGGEYLQDPSAQAGTCPPKNYKVPPRDDYELPSPQSASNLQAAELVSSDQLQEAEDPSDQHHQASCSQSVWKKKDIHRWLENSASIIDDHSPPPGYTHASSTSAEDIASHPATQAPHQLHERPQPTCKLAPPGVPVLRRLAVAPVHQPAHNQIHARHEFNPLSPNQRGAPVLDHANRSEDLASHPATRVHHHDRGPRHVPHNRSPLQNAPRPRPGPEQTRPVQVACSLPTMSRQQPQSKYVQQHPTAPYSDHYTQYDAQLNIAAHESSRQQAVVVGIPVQQAQAVLMMQEDLQQRPRQLLPSDKLKNGINSFVKGATKVGKASLPYVVQAGRVAATLALTAAGVPPVGLLMGSAAGTGSNQQVYTNNVVPAGGGPGRSHAVTATHGRGNRLQYDPRLAAGNYTGAGDHTAAITYYYDGSGSDQTYMSSGAGGAAGRDSYSSGAAAAAAAGRDSYSSGAAPPAAGAGSSYYEAGTGTDQSKWTTFATGAGSEEYYVQAAGDVDHDQAVRYEGAAAAAAGEYYDMNHINAAAQDYCNAGAGTGVIMSAGNYGSIQDYSYHCNNNNNNNMGEAGSDRCDINGVQGGYNNSSAAGAQVLEYSNDRYYTTYTDAEYTAGRGVDQYTDQGVEHMQGVAVEYSTGVEYSEGVEYYATGVEYSEGVEHYATGVDYSEGIEYYATGVEYSEGVEYYASGVDYTEGVEYSAAYSKQ